MNNPVTPRPTEPVPPQITLFHGKAYSGGTFWANAHCNQHQALVDRIASVLGSLPATGPSRPVDCKALNEPVTHRDSMARQPQTAQMQDWIRDQRKKARDRQFAWRG